MAVRNARDRLPSSSNLEIIQHDDHIVLDIKGELSPSQKKHLVFGVWFGFVNFFPVLLFAAPNWSILLLTIICCIGVSAHQLVRHGSRERLILDGKGWRLERGGPFDDKRMVVARDTWERLAALAVRPRLLSLDGGLLGSQLSIVSFDPIEKSVRAVHEIGRNLGALERDLCRQVFADWRDRLTFDMEEVEAQAADEAIEEGVEIEEVVEVHAE